MFLTSVVVEPPKNCNAGFDEIRLFEQFGFQRMALPQNIRCTGRESKGFQNVVCAQEELPSTWASRRRSATVEQFTIW